MRSRLSYPVTLAIVVLGTALSMACSGGRTTATGTVGVFFTDGPADGFSAIEVSVSKIELLGQRRVVIFEGSETFDLLQLQNFSNLFSIAEDVPVGSYDKIRLTLDDLVLVREVDDGMGGTTTEEIHPKLPGNGKLDLNPRGSFLVVPGSTLLVQIDMDAQKSIKITKAGASEKILFRPVVFVKVLGQPDETGKLARVHGTIREFPTADTLVLCSPEIRADDADSHGGNDDTCLTVNLFGDTTAFDENGDPIDLAALMVGDPVTVIGLLRASGGGSHDVSDPEEVGEASAVDSDADAQHEFDLDDADIELDAIVIESGPLEAFSRLSGEVGTPVDPTSHTFDLDLDPGQGFVDPTTLPVLLQDETAVLARDGFRLGDGAIVPGTAAEAFGVLDPPEAPERMKAAAVVLFVPDSTLERRSGEIANVDPTAGRFDLISSSAGTQCIELKPDATVLLVEDVGGSTASSREVTLDDLSEGMQADAYGEPGAGSCFEAQMVIAFGS